MAFSALERLPPWARRVVVVVVALLLVSAAITALTIAPSPGTGVRRAPGRRGPARQTKPHPSRQRVAPPVPAAQLRRAHYAAERFLRTFLEFAYGRARAPAVTSVTRALRRQLVRERAHVTPAERQRHPRVVSLRLVGIMPGFVAATAAVADGGIAMYPLRFMLQRIAGRWSVSDVQAG